MKTLTLCLSILSLLFSVNAAAKDFNDFVPVENILTYEINAEKAAERWTTKQKPIIENQPMMCDDTYYSIVEVKFDGVLDDEVKISTEGDGCQVLGKVTNCGRLGSGKMECSPNWIRFDGPETNCTIKFELFEDNAKQGEVQLELSDAC